MRFVRYKTTVTKVADEQIACGEDIGAILNILKDKKIACSIRLSEGPMYDIVRVTEVGDKTVAFNINKDSSVLRKRVSFEDIDHLEISVEDEKLSLLNPHMSRFFFLGHVDSDDMLDEESDADI